MHIGARESLEAAVEHRRRYPRLLVFLLMYVAVIGMLELPLAWYDTFALEHQFGLSNQAFGAWLADEGKTARPAAVATTRAPSSSASRKNGPISTLRSPAGRSRLHVSR